MTEKSATVVIDVSIDLENPGSEQAENLMNEAKTALETALCEEVDLTGEYDTDSYAMDGVASVEKLNAEAYAYFYERLGNARIAQMIADNGSMPSSDFRDKVDFAIREKELGAPNTPTPDEMGQTLEHLFSTAHFTIDHGPVLEAHPQVTEDGLVIDIRIEQDQGSEIYQFDEGSLKYAQYNPQTGEYVIDTTTGEGCIVSFFDLVKRTV